MRIKVLLVMLVMLCSQAKIAFGADDGDELLRQVGDACDVSKYPDFSNASQTDVSNLVDKSQVVMDFMDAVKQQPQFRFMNTSIRKFNGGLAICTDKAKVQSMSQPLRGMAIQMECELEIECALIHAMFKAN